jgi:hypothetical protein
MSQLLGVKLWIKFSIHSTIGVPVALGESWVLLDEGSLIWLPGITEVSRNLPQPVKQVSSLPTNLKDLF